MDQPYPTTKTNQAKRTLDLSGKEKEVPAQSRNIMNLHYSDSEEEREEEFNLAEQVVAENEELPSSTPKEDRGELVERLPPAILGHKDSTSF